MGGRGRQHNQEERRLILALINEAVANGARLKRAAKTIGLSARTLIRWKHQGGGDDHRNGPMREPANKLTLQEKRQIIDVATSKDFSDLSPKQIVPLLADRGKYIASETTFYRVLREHDMVHHREPSKPANQVRPKEFVATGPCQVWSWDITYMPSQTRGMFFYLYMVIDVWSRKIITARVHESESMELSARLIRQSCMAYGIQPDTLVLHSDNGGPMKGITMLATLQQLGVMPSFSRPGVSDDNPYSESLFRTMKYRPGYPVKPFESLEHAQKWVDDFTAWYNTEHLHSAIRYVTPDDRHYGRQEAILAARNEVYLKAKNRTPERWPIKTRNWEPIGEVKLNPAKAKKPLEKGCDKLAA